MKKIEMINEIKNVVMNNGGSVDLRWITISVINGEVIRTLHGHSKNVKYETVGQIQIYLDCINDIKSETVETEVENNTENVAEPKATKKDIIMGLHENCEVKCDLATAEELANENFIEIEDYEDGVLYGNLSYAIIDEVIKSGAYLGYVIDKYGGFSHSELDNVMNMFDHGYVSSIEYDGKGNWLAEVNWDNILIDFCKRWDNKLNEAA